MRFPWIFVLLAALAVPLAAFGFVQYMLAPVGTSQRTVLIAVKPGSGVSAVAQDLERAGLVRSAPAFSLFVRFSGADRTLKAGVYPIAAAMGAREIADRLVSGRGATARLTVPEGYSLAQIARVLDERSPGSGARFLAATAEARPYMTEFPWLRRLPAGSSLEGFLFPDTYVLSPGPELERELIRVMLARFAQVVLPAYEAAAHPALDLAATLALASIVEKEARHAAERPLIAGVFYNRLATRMPLGSDPTVEYALKRHQGAKGLSFKDVAIESPYNTYKYPGLPPGPIANPGLASVEAVLAPAKTAYLYFVARGDGTHAFTRSYAEHLAAQRRILAAQR